MNQIFKDSSRVMKNSPLKSLLGNNPRNNLGKNSPLSMDEKQNIFCFEGCELR
jgi:hypothetical protein